MLWPVFSAVIDNSRWRFGSSRTRIQVDCRSQTVDGQLPSVTENLDILAVADMEPRQLGGGEVMDLRSTGPQDTPRSRDRDAPFLVADRQGRESGGDGLEVEAVFGGGRCAGAEDFDGPVQ
jgi:hypothetical protein